MAWDNLWVKRGRKHMYMLNGSGIYIKKKNYIYIVWWLHNYTEVKHYAGVQYKWDRSSKKNGVITEVFWPSHSERFACCTLTIQYIICGTIGWSIASISDLGEHIYLGRIYRLLYYIYYIYICIHCSTAQNDHSSYAMSCQATAFSAIRSHNAPTLGQLVPFTPPLPPPPLL